MTQFGDGPVVLSLPSSCIMSDCTVLAFVCKTFLGSVLRIFAVVHNELYDRKLW